MNVTRGRIEKLVTVVGTVVLLSGCSGDVGGTVFVKMQSGDIKRGADLEVVLVQASSQFEEEWRKTVDSYKRAGDDLKEQQNEATAAQERAQRDRLAEIRNPRSDLRNISDASYEAAAARTMELARQVDAARNVQRVHALKLIQWAKKGTTRTSVDGRFQFAGVGRGKYYVVARYDDARNELEWMVPIEVSSGTTTIDLSNSNSGRLLQGS